MLRAILGAIAGYAIWTALWLGGNQVAFAAETETVSAGEPLTAVGTLAAILALSVVCSILAGFVAAKVGSRQARKAVWICGVLLLATGIFVQVSAWSLMPAWYHLTFLALLIPVTLMGGRFAGARA